LFSLFSLNTADLLQYSMKTVKTTLAWAHMDIQNLLPTYDLAGQLGINLRGNETKHGPCPFCGGVDRFAIKYSGPANKQLWMCNQCHPTWGDAIEFVKLRDGVQFKNAVLTLGGDLTHQQKPTMKRPPLPAAADYDTPPAKEWQAAAHVVIQECEAYLWGASPKAGAARGYLNGRGLSDETIKNYRLGYNNGDRKISGLWLFEGFTIPTIIYSDIWQIRTRTPPKHIGRTVFNGDRTLSKYEGITGNKTGLMGADKLAAAHTAILCAGEFELMLAQQHAPTGVACVTFGSETKKLSLRWQIALRKISRLIVAYDNDEGGDKGFVAVREIVPGALRARVPKGKDMGEYLAGGGDLTTWLADITSTPATATGEPFEAALFEWLDTAGYAPQIDAAGHIQAVKAAT
jgi:hypothetical protein